MFYIIIALISVSFNALAQIFLKKSVQQLGLETVSSSNFFHFLLTGFTNLPLLGGILCYAVSIVLWLLALSRLEVSVAYPFQALGYVLVTLIAYFYFHENITFYKIIGISLIIAGVIFVARSNA